MDKLTAKEAVEKLCHISTRTWERTVYTITDKRFPAYNGKKIFCSLEYGEYVFQWEEEEK